MSSTLDSIHSSCVAQAHFDSPLGAMLLARTKTGLAGAWFTGQQHHPGGLGAPWRADDPLLREAARQLRCYFSGQSGGFELPLDLQGTPFQRDVWRALLEIPFAATARYGDIAKALGMASAARAVGAAVARNPVSLVVPCHRVLGSGGALTGYAGGLHRKVALLELERNAARRARSQTPAEACA